jgi:hypothetical protein
MSSYHSATSKMAHFINRLIRPLMDPTLYRSIIVNEADFIQKLNHYAHVEHHLQPTTLFATINISNFHTMTSHKSMIDILGYFLSDHLATYNLQYVSLMTTKLQDISIPTIKKLIELFFANNIFYYNEKIYAFEKGGPTSLLLSETLSDIYLFIWQKNILEDPRLKNELYGR